MSRSIPVAVTTQMQYQQKRQALLFEVGIVSSGTTIYWTNHNQI